MLRALRTNRSRSTFALKINRAVGTWIPWRKTRTDSFAISDANVEMQDADLHDFRDSTATREVYVYDSARFGIRRNRARVLIRQDDVVAIARYADISES